MRDIHRSSTTWLARRAGRGSPTWPHHRSHRRRPTLESLEGRELLSTGSFDFPAGTTAFQVGSANVPQYARVTGVTIPASPSDPTIVTIDNGPYAIDNSLLNETTGQWIFGDASSDICANRDAPVPAPFVITQTTTLGLYNAEGPASLHLSWASEFTYPELAVTVQPPASVAAGSGFGFTVTAEAMPGNVLSSFDGTVTVGLENNPGGATLGGTLTATATNGVATFSGLTLDTAASGYTLLVSAAGMAGATTDAVTVTPAAASQLVVSSQPPGSVLVGSGFGLVVTAKDPFDNVDTNFGGSVAVALLNNPGGSTLGGSPSVTAQNGVATFSGLTLNEPGNGYTLSLSGNGLTSAATNPFNVTLPLLVVTAQPPASILAGSSFGLTVTAEDGLGNVDTSFDGTVTVALSSNAGGGTLGGALGVTAVNGVATFSGLTLSEPGVGYTLSVTSSGLTAVTTSAFNIQTSIATVAVGWGTQTAALQTASDGLRLLPAGRNTDLPWIGINRVQLTLNQPTTLSAGDITVAGSSGINYGPVTVSGSGTSYTITLAQPINTADRVTITIGNATIASFTRQLDVLPGDVNEDGVVNVQDLVAIRNEMLGFLGAVPTIFGDINGDGKVDINDYIAVRKLIGTHW